MERRGRGGNGSEVERKGKEVKGVEKSRKEGRKVERRRGGREEEEEKEKQKTVKEVIAHFI